MNPDAQITSQMLQELLDHYHVIGMGKVEAWQILAGELSGAVGHVPPWTWRYIEGVTKRRPGMNPSQALAHAVGVLGAMVDGMPQVVADTEQVMIIARPGQVQPGAMVMGSSRRCKYPPCPAIFVPPYDFQLYCCKECGRLNQKLMRKSRRRKNE